MRTNAITSVYTGWKSANIFAKSEKNMTRPYLYNEILDITKKFHVPATFHNDRIEFPTPTVAVINKLKELKIQFEKIV